MAELDDDAIKIPSWDDLTQTDQRMLKGLASTFAISGEKVDDMILPNDREAHSIAVEMYALARNIISEHQNGRS